MGDFKGLIAAPYTPVLADGSINTALIPAYAGWLKQNQIKGVFVGGTTGEGLLLSVAKRKLLLEAWIKEQAPDFKIYAHIGTLRYDEVVDLAKHAAALKVDAISFIAPIYFKPSNVDALVEYCARIMKEVPHTPFYYYHMPSMTGISFSMVEFAQKACERIPSFKGIKYTDNNLMEMQHLLNLSKGRYEILNGFDEILISTRHLGVGGSVGSTFNYMPQFYNQMLAALDGGNESEALIAQKKLLDVIDLLIKYKGAMVTGKHIMELIGMPCGDPVFPNMPLTADEKCALKADLDRLGFFNNSVN